MVSRLRGHHLICLHFFSGEGYSKVFVENLNDIIKRAEDGDVEVSSESDDVCIKCPYMKNYRCEYDEDAEIEIREMDRMALKLLNIKENTKIKWKDIKEKIPEIFSAWYENYCYDCDWNQACEKNRLYRDLKIKRGG